MTKKSAQQLEELMFNREPAAEAGPGLPVSERLEKQWNNEKLFWRELDGREPTPEQVEQRLRAGRGRAQELRKAIHNLIREYAEELYQPANIRQLELVRSSYDEEEMIAAIDVVLDDRMTMGPRVAAFEDEWSAFLPAPFSVMVNSGSSANLMMLSALAFPGVERHLQPGDEVILPAVAWSTSLFPIAQVGCLPVLVDVNLDTLNIDPARVEAAITPRTRAIMAVHLLGNPCDVQALLDIARRHHLWLIEDCCESHGASVDGRQVGTFGDLSAFSFFFSHHMTSVEGGMVCGRDKALWRDLLISMRAHGWIRGRDDHDEWVRQCPDIDPRWLFVTTGYNLRPTEINAAFGQVQLSKMPGFIQRRVATRQRVMELLRPYEEFFCFQQELPGHLHTAFGFSFLVRPNAPFSRAEFQAYLESCRIQTRPIVGSNLARQPVMKYVPHRIVGDLPNADTIHFQGVMIANHHNVTVSQQDYLVESVDHFVRRRALV
ncbi:MAG: DegT/DnrJ/EryC1/StrS family aminotransferase [Chloroflexi bacterium]|nr:DegT/DnrJ/EryC1/StrS family aminotransferase [Chloroflexota bacterium]